MWRRSGASSFKLLGVHQPDSFTPFLTYKVFFYYSIIQMCQCSQLPVCVLHVRVLKCLNDNLSNDTRKHQSRISVVCSVRGEVE